MRRSPTEHGNPLVDGLIPASTAGAPTVIAYGHYDVQAPGPAELWDSPPFEPELRDGWLHCRGVTDDKGNFYAVLRAALDLAAAGELGVNVRVLADGEEEIGGHSVIHHLATVEGDFAAAVIFDGGMVDANRPAITTGLRGLAGAQLRLTTGRRELHSGMYGGAAANAVHDLHRVLHAIVDLPAGFGAGVAPVSAEERAAWATLPAGPDVLAEAGAVPADPRRRGRFYDRTGAMPSVTIHSVGAGDPTLHKTSIVQQALASVSVRLAPGQDAEAMSALLEQTLRAACPATATLELEMWPPASASPRWIPATRCCGRVRRHRAGDRRPAAGGALRRHDPRRGRLHRARHPHDPVRASAPTTTTSTRRTSGWSCAGSTGRWARPRDLPRAARCGLTRRPIFVGWGFTPSALLDTLHPQCGRRRGE